MTPDYNLMTPSTRVEAYLPGLWGEMVQRDTDCEFSDLQLASVGYQTLTRGADKWAPGNMEFPDYVAFLLTKNITSARAAAGFDHPAERTLEVTKAAAGFPSQGSAA